MASPRRGSLPGELAREALPEVPQDLARAVVARRAGHAAARMRARAAEIESLDRAAVVGVAQKRARRPELIEGERAVEDIAAHQAEIALEVGGRERGMGHDAAPEAGRMRFED